MNTEETISLPWENNDHHEAPLSDEELEELLLEIRY